jgi:hypothetical protein
VTVFSGHVAKYMRSTYSGSPRASGFVSPDLINWNSVAVPTVIPSSYYFINMDVPAFIGSLPVFTAPVATPAWWRDKVLTTEA